MLVLVALLVLGAAVCGRATASAASQYAVWTQPLSYPSADLTDPAADVETSVTLHAPSGRSFALGAAYVGPDSWEIRFAPPEAGTWTWEATLDDGTALQAYDGAFDVVADPAEHGFLRQRPFSPKRWSLEDGTPFYPFGVAECLKDRSPTPDGESFDDDWGLDYSLTDFDTYWDTYTAAGVNMYRWSIGQCNPLLATFGPATVTLDQAALAEGDRLVQGLHAHGVHPFFLVWPNPPYCGCSKPGVTDYVWQPDELAAVKRYLEYLVDRYGAYVDVWELANEDFVPEGYYVPLVEYLRSIDPYGHPITVNYPPSNVEPLDMYTDHVYTSDPVLGADRYLANLIKMGDASGKPYFMSEYGNSGASWDPDSAERMRRHIWSALFNQGSLIFWNQGARPFVANIYLGPQERSYIRAEQDFAAGLDPAEVPAGVLPTNWMRYRAYVLSSPTALDGYAVDGVDNKRLSTGLALWLNAKAPMTLTWINPATGAVVGKPRALVAGLNRVQAPAFRSDIAFRARPTLPAIKPRR